MIIAAHDANGAPLAGLTPTWVACLVASTGATASQPSITEVGGGLYVFALPDDRAGVIDLGATAFPRYVTVSNADATVFAAYDADGEPLAGLTPAWASWRVAATGADATPGPAITELSGGLYRVESPPDGEVGMLDLGATASPRYVTVGDEIASSDAPPAPTFPDAPLADWIGQAVETIEGIVPRTVDGMQGPAFEAVDGLLEMGDEPQILDRAFDIDLVDSGPVQERWGDDYAQRLARVDVVLVYDRGTTRRDTMARIHEDGFAISARLEDSSHYGNSRIQRVTYLGSATITATASHRIDVRLPFEVLYLEPL